MKSLPAIVLAASVLTACASVPSSEQMAALPVVTYGQAAPAGQPFVLHYPAGTALPVRTAVGGSLLAQEGSAELQVKLKRDIYVYKNLASFDGKHWQSGRDIVGGKIVMTLPGESDGRSPGNLSAQFDLK